MPSRHCADNVYPSQGSVWEAVEVEYGVVFEGSAFFGEEQFRRSLHSPEMVPLL